MRFFIISIFCFAVFSCGAKNTIVELDEGFKREGWVNKNTYRTIGVGKPLNKQYDLLNQKKSSLDAALFNAQFKLKQQFLSDRSHMQAKQIKQIIRPGKVLYKKYDKMNNCEIIYEITTHSLKKIVSKKR